MALTREIFLFFIVDSFGQCYYVDALGKIQTCQPGDPNSWLPQAPHGWSDQQIGYGRNTKYWGLNRSYSQPLRFVNKGATILRHLLYAKRGSEEQIYLVVNKYNDLTDTYEGYYKGEIDLMNNVDDVPLDGITVNLMEGGLLKLFKAYENTTFEIPCDGSIPENLQVNIEGLMFHALFNYNTVPSQVTSRGAILPIVFLNQQGSEAGVIGTDQALEVFDPTNSAAFSSLLNNSSNYLFMSNKEIHDVKISGTLNFYGALSNASLVVWTSLNNRYPLINSITASRVPTGSISAENNYNVDVTIPTLAAGEAVFVMLITSDSSVNLGLTTTDLYVTFDSRFTDSSVWALKPYDLLALLLKKICYTAYTYPENRIYELQSNLLQQHSNLVLTSGSALRKERSSVIKTSLSEFFQAFDAQLSASMGNIQTISGEKLFFEQLNYVFDTSRVSMELGEVAKFKITPATDLYFDLLKIGYAEQKYDERQGNNEWNTTAQYKAPVRKVNKELNKISPYRADSYGVEYTRTLLPTSNSTNNKSDNDTFLLNIDLSKINTAQAYANGVTGNYYGSGYFLPDAGKGLNRGKRMAVENITGEGIAAQFDVDTVDSPGDVIRYVGSNTEASLSFKLQFSFRGDLSTHYFNIDTGIFWNNNVKEVLRSGMYYAFFNIRHNNTILYTQALTLSGGQVSNFTISKHFPNFDLKFADQFQFEILYCTKDPRSQSNNVNELGDESDGFLFVFNIEELTLVISDDNATPVYGLTKKNYESSPLPNANQAYNIEELSPVRLLQKQAGYIKSLLYNQLDRNLIFQVADKNSSLSTTLNGVTVMDGVDVPLGTLPGEILFRPFYFEFQTKVPTSFIDLVKSSANGHIKFSYCGNDFYGFPVDIKVKPALEDAQEWKLLCSPVVDLKNLIEIEYTGLDNIDIMKYNLAATHLSPVKFVQLGFMPKERYNFLHIDQDWFINQVGFWPFKENYFQKWQKNDVLELQCITNSLAPVTASLINSSGTVIDTFLYEQVNDNAVKSPLQLWQASYPLTSLEEGVYYLKLTAGTGTTTSVMISEGLHVKERWPMTLLFEYSSTRNRQATVFTSGYAPSFRVEAWLDEYMPNAKYAIYEDQPANLEMLNAIPYMNCTLNVGDNGGVPAWVIRLVDRILLLNRVSIDGVGYTREQDAKWDKIDVPLWPKKYYKIQLRESENSDFIAVYADGSNTSDGSGGSNGSGGDTLTVVYNINTDAFGDGADDTETIQVTKLIK
jgi:hypothetical protein